MRNVLLIVSAVLATTVIAGGTPTKPAKCTCEPTFCPQIWPQSCYCANGVKKDCYKKCGGPKPSYQSCPPTTTSTPTPTPTPTCQCVRKFCPFIYPEGCYCLNNNLKECYEHCGGPEPSYASCPPTSTITKRATKPTCTCEPSACPMIWPQACYCENDIKKDCYKKCGGPKPTYATCPPTTTVKPTPTPTPQFCGGIANIQCPSGKVCVDNPNDGCDPNNGGADCGGICVTPQSCGGFAGIACPSGKKCVDNPWDSCDPKKGGADCSGICV